MKLLAKTAFIWTVIAVSMGVWAVTKDAPKSGSSASTASESKASEAKTGKDAQGFSSAQDNKDETGVHNTLSPSNPKSPMNPSNSGTSVKGVAVPDPKASVTGKDKKNDTSTITTTTPVYIVTTRQLTLTGANADNNARILEFAAQAGATSARIEGNVLKFSGPNFDQQKFNSLVVNSYPNVNIKD